MAPTSTQQIAILLPLSGDYGHFGDQMMDAIQLALDDSVGVSWRVLDTEGEPDVAERLVRDLASDPSVLAILGPVGRLESEAAAREAQSGGLPILTLTSWPTVESIGDFVFRLRVSPETQAERMAALAVGELGRRRVAVIYPDNSFGNRTSRAFIEAVLSLGGSVTAVETYDPDEVEYGRAVELATSRRYRQLRGSAFGTPPTSRVRRLSHESTVDFDALFMPDDHSRVGVLVPFLSFYDVSNDTGVQLLGVSSWAGEGLQISGELVRGSLFTQIFHSTFYGTAVQTLIERYLEEFARVPSEAEAQAFDSASLILTLLASETHTRRSLSDRLTNLPPFRGLTGRLGFDRDGGVLRQLVIMSADQSGLVSPNLLMH